MRRSLVSSTLWIWIGALGAATAAATAGPCGPGNGPCDAPNGTPGCDDVACCELICGIDPFCCDTEWDQICANEAIAKCGVPTGACCLNQPFGDCRILSELECSAFGGTYFGDGSTCAGGLCGLGACCVDGECLLMSPSACDAAGGTFNGNGSECFPPDLCLPPGACCVDGQCSLTDQELCAILGGEFFGNGVQCEDVPCGIGACCFGPDCIVMSVQDCLNQGGTYLGNDTGCTPRSCVVCGPDAGPCDVPNGTPGCEDVRCCETVCAIDPFCCDTEWDQICVDEAADLCGEPTGACCVFGTCMQLTAAECSNQAGIYYGDGSTDCPPEECGVGACCVDDQCQILTPEECAAFGTEFFGIGSTCTPGLCGSGACCIDGACSIMSPANCAAAGGTYLGNGSECFPPDLCLPPGACCVDGQCSLTDQEFCAILGGEFFGNGVQCEDVPCATGACCFGTDCVVMAQDDCLAQSGVFLGPDTVCTPDSCVPCGPGAGPCDQPNGTPGCEDVECCETVCAVDPFCCDTEWDQICADEAATLCVPPCPCQWDLDGNCNVGPSDLAILLANWNQPYGPADLAALLAEWNCSG